jgi:hypothetical protein
MPHDLYLGDSQFWDPPCPSNYTALADDYDCNIAEHRDAVIAALACLITGI